MLPVLLESKGMDSISLPSGWSNGQLVAIPNFSTKPVDRFSTLSTEQKAVHELYTKLVDKFSTLLRTGGYA